jgi:hypothetical protein
MDAMEPRIALSTSWFNNLVDSLFGQTTSSSSNKPAHLTPQQVAKVQEQRQARQERIAELRQEHPQHLR